jgi:hypothetical protein
MRNHKQKFLKAGTLKNIPEGMWCRIVWYKPKNACDNNTASSICMFLKKEVLASSENLAKFLPEYMASRSRRR